MAITKEIISNALLSHEKYSSYTLSKLMRNTKDILLKMFEEIDGDLNSLEPKKEKKTKTKVAEVDLAICKSNENLGLTYSMAHYDMFKIHNDKNIFEDVIDNQMIDEILSKDIKYRDDKDVLCTLKFGSEEHKKATDEFKLDVLNPLNKAKKRLKILKFLSDQNSVYVNIINIIKKKESKFSYIKDVIRELREYVVVADTATKEFGEVMTPINLVLDMLKTLPMEVWSNPNLKWLDNSNGCGPFPAYVIYLLMKGLESWQPDEDLRYKHIIDNMIYVCELQPKNMFLWLFTIDPKDEYKPNIYCGSFLESGFDYHMKNVWGIEKFDLIIGNPPFNQMKDMDFVKKSYLITDKILIVHPSTWLLDEKGKQSKFITTKELIKNDLESIKLFNGNGVFGVSLFVPCVITYINKNKDKSTIYCIDLINNINVIYNNIYEINKYSNIDIYPKLKNKILNITNPSIKIYNNSDNKFFVNIAQIRGDVKYRDKLGTPMDVSMIADNFYTMITKKVKVELEPKQQPFSFQTEVEANNFLEYIKTNFCRFCLSIYKNNGNLHRGELDIIPSLDFKQSWNDEKLYKLFNLEKNEIEFLEKNIKTYY